jgi:protein-tyrosine phosphatase
MFRGRPDLTEVLPRLWMGSASVERYTAQVVKAGITCVVDLRAERDRPGPWPPGTLIKHMPLDDHEAPPLVHLRAAGQYIAELVKNGYTVLVHCHAGLERTPTVVCAALLMMGWPLNEAYETVMAARPQALPTEAQLAVLRELADELRAEAPQ